jgi:hypothetical protein
VSLVAKVFVVLNLVLSVTFLIFAMNIWTAQTKWQKMYEQEKKAHVENLAKAQKEQLLLAKEAVVEAQKIEELNGTILTLKVDRNTQRDTLLKTSAELAQEKNERAFAQAKGEEYERENKRYLEHIEKLKGVVLKQQQAVIVERENAVRARNEKSQMEEELNVTKQTLAALNRDKRQVEEDLALQTSRITRLLEHGVPIASILGEDPTATQPFIADGRVLAVSPDVQLVMISLGSQQGVKPGYQFTISRGDQYIGKVQVEKVYPDMCSARYVPGMMNKQGLEIDKNDEAKSH